MQKISGQKSSLSKIDHIGVVVRNLDDAIEYFQLLGIGPFETLNLDVGETQIPGKPAQDVKVKIRVAQLGQVQLELIQPIAGESPHKKFLESKGEGINHIGFFVNDIDKEVAKLVEKGMEIIYRIKFQPTGGCVFLAAERISGLIIELIELPPK